MSSTLQLIVPLSAIIGPVWDKVVAVVLVVGILGAGWRIILSLANLITTVNKKFVPNVKYMEDLPKVNKILSVVEAMAGQFERNHGSSLKDDMDANRAAAAEAKQAAVDARRAAEEFAGINAGGIAAAERFATATAQSLRALEILVESIKERAQDDRALARSDRDLARDALEKIRDLMASAQRTEMSGARTEASGARIEADRAVVAEDLAATQKRADDVADHEPPGTAADAASQSAEDADGER